MEKFILCIGQIVCDNEEAKEVEKAIKEHIESYRNGDEKIERMKTKYGNIMLGVCFSSLNKAPTKEMQEFCKEHKVCMLLNCFDMKMNLKETYAFNSRGQMIKL